jgi:hypothetical protein
MSEDVAQPLDRGEANARQMLIESARDPSGGEWREGYNAALTMFLLNAYGTDATFVPATYEFKAPT